MWVLIHHKMWLMKLREFLIKKYQHRLLKQLEKITLQY